MRVLEGGCSVPVGVSTSLDQEGNGGRLTFTACITALDGSRHVEDTLVENVQSVEEAEAIGEKLAMKLIQAGGKEILEEINKDRVGHALWVHHEARRTMS